MRLYDSKTNFYTDQKRTTIFPTLRKNIEARQLRPRQILNYSMDDRSYRMTSNQLIKGIIKQNDGDIKKLRTTFMKQGFQQDVKMRKVGQYQIIKEIGKGGFAQVFEVIDEKGNKYALKEYNLQNSIECFSHESTVGDYFFQKGSLRKQFCSHEGSQNLIKFVDKFRIGKNGYIIQQLVQNNLSKIVSDIQGIFHNNERIYEVKFKDFYRQLASHDYLKKIMLQLCRVMSLVNGEGFIHCDLKLENLMVQFRGGEPVLKLIDFGSTFQREYGLPKITITPQYMPPQLLIMLQNGSSDYQLLKKVDVWSIGCVLLEIMTGVPLWFRYKCRVEIKGRPVVQMGFFSLTGRDYTKIMKKQRQLVQNLNRIPFTFKQFDKFRPLLKRLLVLSPHKRISLEECIKQLSTIQ